MTARTDDLSVWKIIDQRIATTESNHIKAVEGADWVRYQTITSSGGVGTNLSFQIIPGNPNCGISRMIYMTMTGSTVITGGQFTGGASEVGLRNNPLHSCVTTMSMQINSASFTLSSVNTMMPALSFYNQNAASMNGCLSPTASSPDCVAGGLGVGTPGINSLGKYYQGTLFDPLKTATSSLTGGYVPPTRTCQITGVVLNTGVNPNTLTVSWKIIEPLIIPPLLVTGQDEKCIFGVNQATIKVVLDQTSLDQIVMFGVTGGAAAPTIQSTSTNIANVQTSIEVAYFTPSEDSLKTRPVGLQRFNYCDIQLFNSPVTAAALVASGAPWNPTAVNFSLPAMTFPQVPRAIMIWVAPDRSSMSSTAGLATGEPEWFLPINSLNITFGQKNSIFSNASQRALWEASCRAGLCCSFPRFAGYPLINNANGTTGQAAITGWWGGAPVILRAQDLCLPEGICAGASVQTLLQINGTCYNQTNNNLATTMAGVTFTAYVAVFLDGILELDTGNSRNQLIALSLPSIARAKEQKEMIEGEVAPHVNNTGFSGAGLLHRGGSFWDDLYSGVKDVGKTALGLAPLLLGAGASSGGRRRGGDIMGGDITGGAQMTGGGQMTGGARMTRSSIRDRLSQLD